MPHDTKFPEPLAARLLAEAAEIDVTGFTMGMPLHVLLGEAIDVARFCQHYWHAEIDPKTRALRRPGLELAGPTGLPEVIAEEILVLQDLVQRSQTAYVLAIDPPNTTLERATFVLDELVTAIEWICDDRHGSHKTKLATVVDTHRDDPDSEDALAAELADYVGLALELNAELADVGAFDPALVDEGGRLVLALRERSAVRASAGESESGRLLLRRNRLATLLIARIGRVRTAARYVFRHREEIVRRVTSAYQRRRRAAARRRATEDAAAVDPAAKPDDDDDDEQ